MTIDAHQYFWNEGSNFNKEIFPTNLKKSLLPDDIISEAKKFDVEGCIAIQSRQSEEENNFLLNLSNQTLFIKGVVGWVDMHSSIAIDQLSYYSSHSKFLGIRFFLEENNFKKLLTPNFKQSIAFLAEHHLTLDLVCQPKYLRTFIELASYFPNQKFILNDLGNPYIKEGILIPWADDIYNLSEFSNVFCKLTCLPIEQGFTEGKLDNILSFVSVVLQSFGPDRIIFGTDWPLCPAFTEYSKMYELVKKIIDPFTEKEKNGIWGENALRIYEIKGSSSF